MWWWKIAKFAYGQILRDLVKKAIDDKDSEIDEWTMSMLDRIFDYKED